MRLLLLPHKKANPFLNSYNFFFSSKFLSNILLHVRFYVMINFEAVCFSCKYWNLSVTSIIWECRTSQDVWKVKMKSLNRVQLFATLWPVAHQAPPDMGSSRQECWSGLPFPSPRDLPNSRIELQSLVLQADSTVWATRESPENQDGWWINI